MATLSKHIDDDGLRVLVFGEESSAEYQVVASHVESCETCQERLDQLTGIHEIQAKAASLLKGSRPALLREEHEGLDPFDPKKFLTAPSHPELLGRLGRYEIEKVLGQGGMGTVLKGYDTELNRPVAVKILGPHLSHKGAARQRFAREAKAAAAVVHEHVVAIHDVHSTADHPYLVMQYVHGETLQARVDRDGTLAPAEILRIGMQTAAGLAAAHEQGVIHRDVKPGNILLEKGLEKVLITDFGLARTMDDASLTSSGVVAGTPHYMSPEQAGADSVDHRTDLFSLGSVLYFMATGHPPFRAERTMGVLNRICHQNHRPLWEINPHLPDALVEIVDRLLEKKPARRFSSAFEVKAALAKSLEQWQQGRKRKIGFQIRRFLRNNSRPVWVGALGLCVMAGLSWWGGTYLARLAFPQPTQSPGEEATHREKEMDPWLLQEAFRPADFQGAFQALHSELEPLNKWSSQAPSRIVEDPWRNDANQLRARISSFATESGLDR